MLDIIYTCNPLALALAWAGEMLIADEMEATFTKERRGQKNAG